MREYDSVLAPPQRAWLTYHEAKLLADRRRWREAQQALQSLAAQISGLPALETRVWFRLGLAHAAQSQWTAAVPAFERAEALAQQDPEAADQLDRIYDGLAATYRGMGELNRAAEFYQRSIALAEKLGNAPAIASAYNGLGILHRMRGDNEPAVQAFERSLALLPPEGSTLGRAQLYNNIGLIHADRTQWETGRRYLEQSLELLKAAGDSVGQAKPLTNLMRVYMNLDLRDDVVRVGLQVQGTSSSRLTSGTVRRRPAATSPATTGATAILSWRARNSPRPNNSTSGRLTLNAPRAWPRSASTSISGRGPGWRPASSWVRSSPF